MINKDLSLFVQGLVKDSGIDGMKGLVDICPVNHVRVNQVYNGSIDAKLVDVDTVLRRLGYKISFVKINGSK